MRNAIIAPGRHGAPDGKSVVADVVPFQYHDFLPLFTKKGADQLPPHRYVYHEIPIETGKKPPIGRMYSMSATKL